ncbi:hypothetical protein [Richelia sinica]|nr:hypothetical protein [Richelia sinica]MBD2664121.1 hypothetical protein [Richelia sinica FACHB-800]
MNTSVMLDVAIGLVIIYIAAALIVSATQELIASILQWRSQHLEESILQLMLGHDATELQEIRNFRDQIYKNPLIQSMNHSSISLWSRFTSHVVVNWQKRHQPSGQERKQEEERIYEKLYSTSSPSYIEPATFAIALINELRNNTLPFETLQEVITFLESPDNKDKIPQSLSKTLLMLANSAKIKIKAGENALLSFQKEIETWFDTSMKRSAGIYKRNTQLVCFGLSLLITVFFNIDTLYIGEKLLNDSTLRATLANSAGQLFYNSQVDANGKLNIEQLEADFPRIFNTSLPIAPFYENFVNFQDCPGENICPFNPKKLNPSKFLSGLLGWLITTLAAFMGAPFWFDLLGKLVNVRATGGKPNNS